MITGEIKSQVDKIWETLWSGGISNPLSVIEQLTYLLFIKGLDEVHTLKENKANRTIEAPIFTPEQQHLRWSHFKEIDADAMSTTVRDEVFPFIKSLDADTSFNQHMEDAQFIIPKASLLANVVDQLDAINAPD